MSTFKMSIPATPNSPACEFEDVDLSTVEIYAEHLLENIFNGKDGFALETDFVIYLGNEPASYVVRLPVTGGIMAFRQPAFE